MVLISGESKSRVPAFILRGKKGGYKIYCHGILGFLPGSQFKILLMRLYKNFNKKKLLLDYQNSKRMSYISFFSFFLSINHKLKKYGLFRIPLYAASGVLFKPYFLPKQFSKSNYIKKFRGSLSPVFIYKTREKKLNPSVRKL